MLCLVFLSFVTITLSGIYSEHIVKARSIEFPEDILRCQAHCKKIGRNCERPPYQCSVNDAGNNLDVEGCPEFQCGEVCQYGYFKNEHNCPICRCLPNPPDQNINPACPIPMCDTDCPNGYANNERGCMTCTCKHSPQERDVIDEDLDSLIEEFRRIGQNHQHEIAKDVQAPGAAPAADPTTVAPPSQQQQVGRAPPDDSYTMNDKVFTAVVAGCSVAGLVGLVVAGVCWYRLQKNVKATSEVEYPAYGITGPTKGELGSPGDRKLAQSAQMYHYQHQKQQMIALEKANGEMKNDGSEDDSDEENEEGDYTVYECPGLAPTGEMEVKNPLFSEETPVTPTPDDRREMK